MENILEAISLVALLFLSLVLAPASVPYNDGLQSIISIVSSHRLHSVLRLNMPLASRCLADRVCAGATASCGGAASQDEYVSSAATGAACSHHVFVAAVVFQAG